MDHRYGLHRPPGLHDGDRRAPINYTSGASTYTAQGLDIVEKPDIEGVTVKVEGNSTIIGNIRSADIMVYPSYAGVSGAARSRCACRLV